MKAIVTKRLAVTATKPARIKASDSDGNSITISYPVYAYNAEDAHRIAAQALCSKMRWYGSFVQAGFCNGYVFVFKDQR